MRCHVRLYICLGLTLITLNSTAQSSKADTTAYKRVAAGPEYQRPLSHQKKWGRNHRVEWTTPIRVPVLKLDTAFGGLIPYEAGGGNESKSLKLRTKNGKEYALRSINKSRTSVIPDNLKGTFMEDVVIDGVSMSHPYGAFAVGYMMERAGIYHSWPKVVYLPKQQALDTFNNKYGNDLYLLEQKAEGDWREADNLGNFSKFYETEEVLAKLKENNVFTVDQHAYIKARLFDMLIGDWDRHEGNWSWGEVAVAGGTQFKPVPKDRDQSFFYHDGFLIDRMVKAAGLFYMQHYDSVVKNISLISHSARYMDRYFTNSLTLDDWIYEAEALQKALTDTVIVRSVAHLPAEVYAVKGEEMIDKIKARRNQLPTFAKQHYLFIAKEVEVIGSKQQEYFEVISHNDETVVTVFRINKGQKADTPYYQRTFKPAETKEVRLFGINNEDVYVVDNNSDEITIRIIGGPGKDSIVQAKEKIHVYDNRDNTFQTANARMHLSSDTSIHAWDYKWFRYGKKGFRPSILYNNEDRFYVGLRYRFTKNKWRESPYAAYHSIGVNYSLVQNALSAEWRALYPNIIGRWNLALRAEYDAIRWTNFYGTGNETKSVTNDLNYYRIRSVEMYASAGLNRLFGKNTVQVTGFYQRVKNKNDTDRFPSKVFTNNQEVFLPNQYAGVQLTYSYVSVNDSVVPVKGFIFLANGTYAKNFEQNEFFQRYNAQLQGFYPLTDRLSLAVRLGGETIVNDAVLNSGQAYQHAIIGGPRNLRGYRRERFWGQTAVYNNNEIRYITSFRSRLMTGKIGLFAFFDQGRVWMPGEDSDKIHTSWGPGMLLAPFNKISLSVSYGITEENRLVQIRLNRLL
jgi:hypothetical protein